MKFDLTNDFAKIESILSELEQWRENPNFCLDEATLERLESTAVHLRKYFKKPSKYLADEFERRSAVGFFRPHTKLNANYFDFLWTFLLCMKKYCIGL